MRTIEIRIRGQLDEHWSTWFEDLAVVPTVDGDTLLTGAVRDQADLYGLLARLRDLGLTLVSVQQGKEGEVE